jgi:hypothetical protein
MSKTLVTLETELGLGFSHEGGSRVRVVKVEVE